MTLARLVRAYGLAPQAVMATPRYLLAELIDYLPALEAEEQQLRVAAATAPHLRDHDRRAMMRRLERQTSALRPAPAPMQIIEEDPEKAAEWFRAMGVKVVQSG